MNTLELLYQIYRARYSLSKIQEGMDQEYVLALIGEENRPELLRRMLGGALLDPGQEPQEANLRLIPLPLDEAGEERLMECKAAIIHLGGEEVPDDQLRALAERLPLQLTCLWVREGLRSDTAKAAASDGEKAAADPTLPITRVLEPSQASTQLCRLVLNAFPDLSIRMARDFPRVRQECARRAILRASTRNAMLAAASSVTVNIPAVGFLLSFLATAGETLVITASQLRLCMVMAALYGRNVDFFDRVGELWPVVGGAFGWRALARELVGAVPGAGWAIKAGIAFSGTWAVGEAARLYYEHTQSSDSVPVERVRHQAESEAREAARRFVADIEVPRGEPEDEGYDPTLPDRDSEASPDQDHPGGAS